MAEEKMAFAGTFGAAGNMIPEGIMYHHAGSCRYAADGVSVEILDENGNWVAGGEGRPVNLLWIWSTGDPLAAVADGTIDGSAADTGIITTAAPAGDLHGIPANFGPGRGNWTFADFARTLVTVDVWSGNPYNAAGGGQVAFRNPGAVPAWPNAGDWSPSFKNTYADAIGTIAIKLVYLHSII